MNTHELTEKTLDWAVAKAFGLPLKLDPMGFKKDAPKSDEAGWWIWDSVPSGLGGININKSTYMKIGSKYSPSKKWDQGGPIIEHERIALAPSEEMWVARIQNPAYKLGDWLQSTGPTPLIAAMRAYVASKFGAEIKLPQELK